MCLREEDSSLEARNLPMTGLAGVELTVYRLADVTPRAKKPTP